MWPSSHTSSHTLDLMHDTHDLVHLQLISILSAWMLAYTAPVDDITTKRDWRFIMDNVEELRHLICTRQSTFYGAAQGGIFVESRLARMRATIDGAPDVIALISEGNYGATSTTVGEKLPSFQVG